MQTSLLTTKLYFPLPRASLVPRPRLVERLQSGLGGPLTLISAPPGSGKTTLLGEWRAGPGAGAQVAWLSLDAADNDLARFFQYLCAALDAIQPGLGQQVQPLLAEPGAPPSEAILTLVLNMLSAGSQDFVLVMDDYHLIENTAIHQALAFLLEHQPPTMHLALLTRSDPPLPLARLRARAHLVEIRTADLRFTVDEVASFLNQVMGLDLTGDQVAALEKRTEGWIAGLQLAALSMQGRKEAEGFLAAFSGSHQYIVDYLGEELLNRQHEAVQAFLLQTSLLDRVTGDLCDAVTGRTDSQAMLQYLAQANLFLIPLDDERRWYRYHHLFADLLHKRLKTSCPEQIPELHRRAAAWFDRQGIANEAIEHALLAQDYAEARRLMRAHFPTWARPENMGRVMEWLAALPQDFLRSEPWLCVIYAWRVWSLGKLAETEKLLDVAQNALEALMASGNFPAGDLEYDGLAAEILGFRALVTTQKNDPEKVIEMAHQALALAPAQAYTVRAVAYGALQIIYREIGELDRSIEYCQRGLPDALAGGQTGTIGTTYHLLGGSLTIQGQLHQAADVYRAALTYAESKDELRAAAYSLIRMRLAYLHYQWNQLEQAEALTLQGLERADLGVNFWTMIYGRYMLCMIYFARGDHQGVQDRWQEMEAILPKAAGTYYFDELKRLLAFAHARLGLSGKFGAYQPIFTAAVDDNLTTAQFEELLFQAHHGLIFDQVDQSAQILNMLERIAYQRGHISWLAEIHGLQALIWGRKGNHQAALECLQKALNLAEPQELMRIFLDEGEPMRDLLHAASARVKDERLVRFVRRLLADFGAKLPSDAPAKQPLISPLSPRELELLSLVAAGRSNKEIAHELYISLGTVKRHTVNIFNKLDVKNRTEAVAKAREMGLL